MEIAQLLEELKKQVQADLAETVFKLHQISGHQGSHCFCSMKKVAEQEGGHSC